MSGDARAGTAARTTAVTAFAVVLGLLVCAGCAGPRSLPADSAVPPEVDGSPQASAPSPSAGPSPASQRAAAGRLSYLFPVRARTSFSRFHHDYPAADVFAACRSRVVAPVRGVILEVSRRDRYRPGADNPALRGGRFWSLRGADGVRYYGSHMLAIAPHLRAGRHVRRGALLGRVGQSGNARGVGCHVHFGISPPCRRRGDWWIRRGEVRPYRFLRAWQRHVDRSPAGAVRRWHARHGCPRRPG